MQEIEQLKDHLRFYNDNDFILKQEFAAKETLLDEF
jgi:hypothetical protein